MPLTTRQLDYLEKRLQEERQRLVTALNRFAGQSSEESGMSRSGELSSIPVHLADIGTDTIEEELAASNATRQSAELAEIDAALDRLIRTPETFGRDEVTGQEIPFERLDMIPWARRRRETVSPASTTEGVEPRNDLRRSR